MQVCGGVKFSFGNGTVCVPIGKEGVVDTKDPEMFSVCIKLCNLFPRPRAMACAILGDDKGKTQVKYRHPYAVLISISTVLDVGEVRC